MATSAPRFERPFSTVPAAQGLYDPRREKDACGLAMVATLRGTAGHDIIDQALDALRHLEHRGAVGSDAGTGDGAGIVTQIPDAFLRAVVDFELPAAGAYAVGIAFLPLDDAERARAEGRHRARSPSRRASRVLGWRDVPDRSGAPRHARPRGAPAFEQLFVASPHDAATRPVGHRARPADVPAAQARRARARRLLPVAVGRTLGLQGHGHDAAARAVLPRPAATSASRRSSRSCTRATRPTPSRRGRSRSRSA